ncbi:STAS domain-containing protein [Planomonospora sp. ID67723]|uniref:STAS domain-containing protein n=1 Tax=Planomonospora sp. ID67723 TaxID=2738134 RepID=UPI0018C43D16|nr:STAS domain-containing protein [Planomonospora sp. ID67723]MBG0829669.1 STAS domain-containing protein [Planomonospora sp. ID67723]
MDTFRVTTRHGNGRVLITVAGELDIATRPELCACADRALRTRPGALVVDLGGITFVDACGLGTLIALGNRAATRGTPLLLSAVSPAVRSLLLLTGLDECFTMSPGTGTVLGRLARAGEPGPRAGSFARSGLPPVSDGHRLEL